MKSHFDPKHVPKPKFFHFKGEDEKEYSLTPLQKAFCEFFCDLSMNGPDAVIKAGYNVSNKLGFPDRRLAHSISDENLHKPALVAYINTILSRYGLLDDHVDKQLSGVINQWNNLSAKIKGIDIFYKKKGAYSPEKHEYGLSTEVQRIIEHMKTVLPAAK